MSTTPDYILTTRKLNDETGLRESIEADARIKEACEDAPQPAPDAEGEWTLHEGEDYIVVLGGECDTTENPIARCYDLEHAAQIVSDHTLAASVPKLVGLLERTEKWFSDRNVLGGEAPFLVADIRAALASTQIQEKQR